MRYVWLIACALIAPHLGWANETSASDKLEMTVGLSRTNQSLLRGVLVTYQNEPTLNVNYETSRGFASMQNGIGVWLLRDELLKVGMSVNYMLGRQEHADPRYFGIGDVTGSAMNYVWAEWQPIKDAITFYGNAGNAWRSSSGTLAQWGATVGFPLVNQTNGFVDVSRYWGNQRYVQQYYGVSPNQTQTSRYAIFNARTSGVLYSNIQAGVAIEIDSNTDLIAALGRSTASAMLMESPVLNQKSQMLSTLVLSRRFP